MMSNQEEFDHLFDEFKKIERPPFVKRQTLENVLSSENKKVKFREGKKNRFIPAIVAMLAVVVTVFLVFSVLGDSPVNQQTSSDFANIEVEKGLVAQSVQLHSFKATLPLTQKVRLVEDSKWNQSVERVLSNLEEGAEIPASSPAFDLSIYTEEQKNYRFKVWNEQDALIIMDLETEKVYTSNSEDAARLLLMMERMYNQ